MSVAEIARELGEDAKELERKALISYLRERLRRVRAEKVSILNKYDVKSFEELWKLIEKGEVSDVKAHDDIVKLDYLEYEEKKLLKLLERVGSARRP